MTGESSKRSGKSGRSSMIEGRRRARRLVVQALYQWQLTKDSVHGIEAEFRVDNDMSKVDVDYFRDLLQGVVASANDLDGMIEPVLTRKLTAIDPIELAIVRLGVFELRERLDIPYRVVINEGVELAKRFGGTDGHRFVNRVLDSLAPDLRKAELQAGQAD